MKVSIVWSLLRHTDWGLRKYSGNMARVWGGVDGCAHEWGEEHFAKDQGDTKSGFNARYFGKDIALGKQGETAVNKPDSETSQGQFCLHCHAWYGELGLEPTPEQYVANMVAVFREVWRVCRPDSTVWLNMGDSYASSWASGRRSVIGNPSRTNRRIQMGEGLKEKDLVGIPWRLAFALQADGWWLRSDIIWSKPNPMPESVTDRPTKAHEYLFLLTKSARYFYDADAVREAHIWADRDKRSLERRVLHKSGKRFLPGGEQVAMQGVGYHPAGRNRRTVWNIATAPYSGAHFATYPPALVEPCVKAGTSERGVCPECGSQWQRVVEKKDYGDWSKDGHREDRRKKFGGGNEWKEYEPSSTIGWMPTCTCVPVWHVGMENDHEPVPAVVFDPFAGSGTTLLVARALGRHGIGIDLSAEYLQLARERLSLDALEDWEMGKKDGKGELTDLPLFEEST